MHTEEGGLVEEDGDFELHRTNNVEMGIDNEEIVMKAPAKKEVIKKEDAKKPGRKPNPEKEKK